MRKRADVLLVEKQLAPSRAKAQEAIAAGLVRVDGRVVQKPAEQIDEDATIMASAPYPWVSRGGLKLVAALDHFKIDPMGQIALDVGASTGGFSDVLLARGATKIYAVDVGHDQLHPKLRADHRVVSMEGTDARVLTPAMLDPLPQLIVCDASFISLKLVLSAALDLVAPGALLAALIKPQFEAGRAHVTKGLVRDPDVHARVCNDISTFLLSRHWQIIGLAPSPITGGDGNCEFLIGARKLSTP